METLQLRLDFAGMEGSEKALDDLEKWLKSAGFSVQALIEPPEKRELGGKLTALTLLFALASESSHLPPEVEEGLQAVLRWQHAHREFQPVVYATGQTKKQLEEIIKKLNTHLREPEPPPEPGKKHVVAPPHIEIREPEPPPKKEKDHAVAPPPPKPGVK